MTIRQRSSGCFRRGRVNPEGSKDRDDGVPTDMEVPALPVPVLGRYTECLGELVQGWVEFGAVEFWIVEFWHGANLGSSWRLADFVGSELAACAVDLATTRVADGDRYAP